MANKLQKRQTPVSDEAFLENWLQFAALHRVRLAVSAATALHGESDESIRASLMLEIMQQYFQANEDMAVWSNALRRLGQHPDNLVAAVDGASAD